MTLSMLLKRLQQRHHCDKVQFVQGGGSHCWTSKVHKLLCAELKGDLGWVNTTNPAQPGQAKSSSESQSCIQLGQPLLDGRSSLQPVSAQSEWLC